MAETSQKAKSTRATTAKASTETPYERCSSTVPSYSSNLIKLYPPLREENLITLAMLITGILRSKSGQLKKIARAVQYAYKKESLGERFRRFVRNKNIEVEVEYTPFVTMFLSALSTEQLMLMIDSTKMGGQSICLIRISVHKPSWHI